MKEDEMGGASGSMYERLGREVGKPKRRESGLKTYAKSTGALSYVTTRIHSSLRLLGLMGGSTPLAAIPACRELGSTRLD